MKIGIFTKTFNRPTIEELFQAIASYRIYFVRRLRLMGRAYQKKTFVIWRSLLSLSGTPSTTSIRFHTPLQFRSSSLVPGLFRLRQKP